MAAFPIALQLYSVREAAQKDFAATLRQVAGFGYAGVEFAGLHGQTPAQVRKMIDDLGVVAAAAHGPLPTKENLGEIVDTAGALGYQWHVVSALGPDKFPDEATTRKTIDLVKAAIALLQPTGLKMAVHNHWWEFDKKFSGKTPHELLMAGVPRLAAEIDTYWTAVAGENAAAVVERDGARAPLLHIKDGPINREEPQVAVGDGKMDWPAVLGAARRSGRTEWLIVELDRCATDMLEAARKSYSYLARVA
jgi:sugar phosphate isomerase/epimerase